MRKQHIMATLVSFTLTAHGLLLKSSSYNSGVSSKQGAIQILKKAKRINICLTALFTLGISAFMPNSIFASSCETDGPDGTWVEITQDVPEGECLDTSYVRRYSSVPNHAWYYLEGRSSQHKILIPSGDGLLCLIGSPKTCNCSDYTGDAISRDAYRDCWEVTERCNGNSCNSPPCTSCWSVGCWWIINDNGSHRRRVYEWICDDCSEEYNNKLTECGGAGVLNWDNETCTGECKPPCYYELIAKAEECKGKDNINIINWNYDTCEGDCLTEENFGPPGDPNC